MPSQFPDGWQHGSKATASAPGHHRRLQSSCGGAIRTALTERICNCHPALDVASAGVLLARYPLLDVRFGRELNIGVLARASTDQPPQTPISEESMPDIRKETDGLGVVEVPADKPCVLRYNVRSS